MSKVAEQKRNWLDQVKADAEEITRARLAVDLPKMEQEIEAMHPETQSAEEAPAPETKDKKGAK
jgi:hypothetical protein